MADDYSSDTTRTGLLSTGGQTTGSFEAAYDNDWFKVALTAGNYYTFELSGGTGFNPGYSQLSAYDAQGAYQYSNYGSYGNTTVSLTFKAAVTGNYYIAAGDRHYDAITATAYTLKAGAGVADDVGDTRAAAKTLALDVKTRGVFEGPSDTDYYKIAVVAGKTYSIATALNPDGTGSSSSYSAQLRLEDATGGYLNGYYLYNASNTSSFTATSTGDLYVAAVTSYGAIPAYTLTFGAAADDFSASKTGAGTLPIGTGVAGVFNVANDKDWFAASLTAGATYWFTLGTAGDTGGTAYSGSSGVIKVFDADGNVMATSSGYTYVTTGTSLLLQYVPAKSGVYYAEVADTNGGTGRYTLTAALGEVDDVGDTQVTATALSLGATQKGRLAIPTDRDVYKIAVKAGSTYLIEMNAQDVVNSASPYVTASLADGYYGDGLTSYTKPGVTDYKVYTATQTGDYYVTVSNNNQRGTAGYTLKVSEPAVDDYAAAKSTSGALTVGGKTSGKIDYTGDVDWVKVTLQFGVKYAFQLRGAGSGEGTLVLDGGNNLSISSSQQSGYSYLSQGNDGTYTFTSQTGGDYYLAVRGYSGYSGTSDGTGAYALHAVALSGDTSAPTVTSYSPAENAGLYDNIVVQFSEAIMRGTNSGNAYITLRDSLGVALESYYGGDSRIAINGNTLTINPSAQLKLGTKYFLDIPAGTVTDLAGNQYAGGELYTVNTIPTVTIGGAGNDYLVGLGNGIKLDGGAGVDTVVYGYSRGNYQVTHTAADTKVQSSSWPGSTAGDVLTGVERLVFSDTAVALDTGGTGGQAYRLYQAAFNRAPDKAGVGYWIAQLDKGAALLDVARGFLDSAEFASLYGTSPGNGVFVQKLYDNVLHRTPDQAGVDYWLGVLNQGGDRAEVLAAFSESPENQKAALQVIGNGFEYTPYG
ncbi:DUF4214 domain-containing protein [Pseudoduganella namucuonensis]|uniref:DUF4214 domain-containing protein n=1 Tax=Pseudoduganella namucuonensis TaxID=1035707 RepID=A0A1I7KWF7_9BURK|nr:DUF4214 domain-containing protein [Pseudoduganella namucuonensis]SFV01822.1 protein of unknown function [Pseudoduganella namucuonensis]